MASEASRVDFLMMTSEEKKGDRAQGADAQRGIPANAAAWTRRLTRRSVQGRDVGGFPGARAIILSPVVGEPAQRYRALGGIKATSQINSCKRLLAIEVIRRQRALAFQDVARRDIFSCSH
jgi:hypothetical protein